MRNVTLTRPTGLREPESVVSKVDILGFCYGRHEDARGYDREGECALAIISHDTGAVSAVPVRWLSVEDRHP